MDSHDWFIDELQTNNILYRIEETVKKKICIIENGLNLKDHIECRKIKFVTITSAYVPFPVHFHWEKKKNDLKKKKIAVCPYFRTF